MDYIITKDDIQAFSIFYKSNFARALSEEMVDEIGLFIFGYKMIVPLYNITNDELDVIMRYVTYLKIDRTTENGRSRDTSRPSVISRLNPRNALRLRTLDLSSNNAEMISIENFEKIDSLSRLIVRDGILLTDLLKNMTNLRSLTLDMGAQIDIENGLSSLTNLQQLYMIHRTGINSSSISHLTQLTSLSLSFNQKIHDDDIKNFTLLNELDLWWNDTISNNVVSNFINLTYLCIGENNNITDNALIHLTKLKELNVSPNCTITDRSIKELTQLTSLDIYECFQATEESIKYLTNLRKLRYNFTLSEATLKLLPNLKLT